jgi:hypothetical protein
MARQSSSQIRPGVELHKITLTLDRSLPPSIEMSGRIVSGNRQIDQASSVTIKTMTADAETVRFVNHIKALFGGGGS